MNAPFAPSVDLLAQAIARARPLLRDGPTKARTRALWAAARGARHLGTDDVVADAFMRLAAEVKLIDRRGCWLGEDVRADLRRHGAQDIAHVIAWALRNRNPLA